MATIINSLGNEIDFEAATNIMDRDICEELREDGPVRRPGVLGRLLQGARGEVRRGVRP